MHNSHAFTLHVIFPLVKPFNQLLFSFSYHCQVISIQQFPCRATVNSLDMASMTMTNNSGLNAVPWCIPTFT